MPEIITAGILMASIGLLLGGIIGLFARLFRVESDRRIELVIELLPGANCGGCGKAGCADFAKSVVAGENAPGKCPVCSRDAVTAIAQALGLDPGVEFRQVALVRCGGDYAKIKAAVQYNGVSDCVSASLIAGGPKSCAYGCLGMSSCSRACPFGAIEMINGLAVVHSELCVGCAKCVSTCPRQLIVLVPATATAGVFCNSPQKGGDKRMVCDVPCIGCRKCAKAAPEKFKVTGFLASVDYEAEPPTPDELEAAACPTGCLKPVLTPEVTNG